MEKKKMTVGLIIAILLVVVGVVVVKLNTSGNSSSEENKNNQGGIQQEITEENKNNQGGIQQEIIEDIISRAQESANQMTVKTYAQRLVQQYLMDLMQYENVNWVDKSTGKIDFSKVPEMEIFSEVICTGDSYIDEEANVTLADCKVDNMAVLYQYKDGQVTSNYKG